MAKVDDKCEGKVTGECESGECRPKAAKTED